MDTKTEIEITLLDDRSAWTILIGGDDVNAEGEPCRSLADLRAFAREMRAAHCYGDDTLDDILAAIDGEVERCIIDPQDYADEILRGDTLRQRVDGCAYFDASDSSDSEPTDEDLVHDCRLRAVDACDVITDAAHVRPWRPGRS